MSNDPTDPQRRTVLRISVGLAAAGPMAMNTAIAAATPPAPTDKPGDFDFLSGQPKIKNRQLKKGEWDSLDSEATVLGILGASVEELRIPVCNFSGMGLRLLDLERKLWADYWVNSKSGSCAISISSRPPAFRRGASAGARAAFNCARVGARRRAGAKCCCRANRSSRARGNCSTSAPKSKSSSRRRCAPKC